MERAVDGNGHFLTPDGLTIRVALAVVFGDGAPRVEIKSLKGAGDLIPVHAIESAAKAFLLEVTWELRRQAYRERPFTPDPKPKDRKVIRSARAGRRRE